MKEKVVYVADDGKQFSDKDECRFYEGITELVDKECYNGMDKDNVVTFLCENRKKLIQLLAIPERLTQKEK